MKQEPGKRIVSKGEYIANAYSGRQMKKRANS